MIIDVKFNSGDLNYDEAVKFLEKNTGFSMKICESEILMYSQSPGYFLSYALGNELMKKLKLQVPEMKDKEFNDKILYDGNVPFWFLKEKIFNISE